jgi:serine/threonine protein kinase
VFWTLFGLLALVALLLFALTLLARRLERRMREAVIEAGQLGQYALEKKIGEGGMGSVYRARHAMLRRPTAVKLLEPSKTTEVSVARFEREVQLTSQLNHPNTITIYDYGRTGEGVFYYAMEYLDGFSLDTLVKQFGPQPDGRVIHILTQVCGSLVEAHSAGLIHRDIKPANIMLTRRGGVCDYVKLLDFGLVKAVDSEKMRTLTAADAITGTPLYITPETIEDSEGSDARSDLYSLGAVGYYLLTGKPVFDAGGIMEIMRAHVQTKPIAPSKRLARPMSSELEQLILRCLAKSPAERPQTAAEMALELARCVPVQPWGEGDAQRWWQQQQATLTASPGNEVTQDLRLASTMAATDVKPAD